MSNRSSPLDALYACRTYADYLHYFDALIEFYKGQGDVAPEFPTHASDREPKVMERVESCLLNAWSSEYALAGMTMMSASHTGEDGGHYLPFLAHWAAIQSYYAIYGCARALLLVLNGNEPRNHTKTWDILMSTLVSGMRQPVPRPWCLAVGSNSEPISFPQGFQPQSASNITGDWHVRFEELDIGSCFQGYYRWLRKAREKEIFDVCRPFRRRLREGRQQQMDTQWKPTTVFVALRRLRERCCYEDALMFMCAESDGILEAYGRSLRRITYSTLEWMEQSIRSNIGGRAFDRIIGRFDLAATQEHTFAQTGGVLRRWKTTSSIGEASYEG